VYNHATNGLAEAFNKAIIKLLKKFITSSKEIGLRSSVNVFRPIEPRSESLQANTPFSLVYEYEQSYP